MKNIETTKTDMIGKVLNGPIGTLPLSGNQVALIGVYSASQLQALAESIVEAMPEEDENAKYHRGSDLLEEFERGIRSGLNLQRSQLIAKLTEAGYLPKSPDMTGKQGI